MADLNSKNNDLTIMRLEHTKMMAELNIKARLIRKVELHEEIERCDNDIEAQKKVIAEQDKLIAIQIQAEKQKPANPPA